MFFVKINYALNMTPIKNLQSKALIVIYTIFKVCFSFKSQGIST